MGILQRRAAGVLSLEAVTTNTFSSYHRIGFLVFGLHKYGPRELYNVLKVGEIHTYSNIRYLMPLLWQAVHGGTLILSHWRHLEILIM